jgi:hypothetical protein
LILKWASRKISYLSRQNKVASFLAGEGHKCPGKGRNERNMKNSFLGGSEKRNIEKESLQIGTGKGRNERIPF